MNLLLAQAAQSGGFQDVAVPVGTGVSVLALVSFIIKWFMGRNEAALEKHAAAYVQLGKEIKDTMDDFSKELTKCSRENTASNYRLANAQLLLVIALKQADATVKVEAAAMKKDNELEQARATPSERS